MAGEPHEGNEQVAMRRRPALLLVLLMPVTTFGGSPARAADALIQPGAPTTGCTLNFVFEDADDRLYIGTAGHCTSLGARAKDGNGDEFGTVVYQALTNYTDFALIRIDAARYDDVSPSMRAWGGPTGMTSYTETTVGDRVLLHGFGIVFGETEPTRSRPGVLVSDTLNRYHADLPAIFGDSGGPILHAATGRALGFVSGIDGSPTTLYGTTVEWAIAELARAGINVTVKTAPYSPVVP
jgi:hypothetical protein